MAIFVEPVKTWRMGDLGDADLLNQEIRDRLLVLFEGKNDGVHGLPWFKHNVTTANHTNATTTPTDVTGLSFPVGKYESWIFLVQLGFNSPAAADMKFEATFPTGATGRWGLVGANAASTAAGKTSSDFATNAGRLFFPGNGSTDEALLLHGLLHTEDAEGTFQVQAAQNANSGTNTIYSRASIMAIRIA